ncbi:MAG: FAD-linked sulfhydryl oxidase [Candidatus Hodarchaeales archaeon]|jgi:hypothetical protein
MSGIQKWAPQTWNFFHTFAAKINDTFYQQNKEQCLQIIKLICQSLPCPECTKHAIQFMNTVNSKNVKNKEELNEMLYTFHNIVNIRIGKPPVDRTVLQNYKFLRFDIVYLNFINGYTNKYGSIMSGKISTLGKRRSTAKAIEKWMRDQWKYFQ